MTEMGVELLEQQKNPTPNRKGRQGSDAVRVGGVMESQGSFWEVEVINYLHSTLANPAL